MIEKRIKLKKKENLIRKKKKKREKRDSKRIFLGFNFFGNIILKNSYTQYIHFTCLISHIRKFKKIDSRIFEKIIENRK